MRLPLKLAASLGLLATAVSATASTTGPGYIYGVQAINGLMYFESTGTRSADAPACQYNPAYANRWVFDPTTTDGQITLSVILTLYASHKPLTIAGTGNCIGGDPAETFYGYATADNP